MAKKRKVHTDGHHTTKFGDDKGQGYILAKNHDASRTRSMNQLRKLLCISGERSYGMNCVTCESKCQFGMEHMKRQKNEEDYFVIDRTGTPHVVVAVKAEISEDCPQNGNREVEG